MCARKGEGQGGSEEAATFEGYHNSEGDWGKREARGECHAKASVIEYRGLPGEGGGKFPRLTFWCVRILQVDFPRATDCRSIPLLRLHVSLLRSALYHLNIARFVDCFEDEENIYMTLELCPMTLL